MIGAIVKCVTVVHKYNITNQNLRRVVKVRSAGKSARRKPLATLQALNCTSLLTCFALTLNHPFIVNEDIPVAVKLLHYVSY